MIFPLRKTAGWLVAGICLLAVSGCQTPDLKPFADSTASMHTAVRQSREIFVRELEAARDADQTNPDYPKLLSDFDKHWSNRLAVMEAMVKYSETLAAVADAPRAGAENVKAIGNSVKQVATVFGPYGAALEGGIEIGQKVYDLAAQALAARTLRNAVGAADPVVSNVSAILIKDLSGMADAFRIASPRLSRSVQKEYEDPLDARKNLVKRRKELYNMLSTNSIDEAGSVTNAAAAAAKYNADVVEIDKTLAEMDQWYRPLMERRAAVERRLSAGTALLENTAFGFQQWAATHHALADDIQQRRQPNWRLLLQTAQEIEGDIERMRKQ